MPDTANSQTFVDTKLGDLRKKLLDLTGRNRLINYRHTKTASLRIIDELPDQLLEKLIGDKVLKFGPVPQPTEAELIKAGYLAYDEEGDLIKILDQPEAEEWASQIGLDPSYDLPAADQGKKKHHDNQIQTLLYSEQLEARLRSLYNKANLTIDETGTNILYLALGFLEWYEAQQSDQAHVAPLFLIPVTLKKGKLDRATSLYSYTLEYSGEDILPNISLVEKLRTDFQLKLPDLDETTEPESYFTQVSDALVRAGKKRWRVKRWSTLTLLNFSKLLMYLDLDPNRWPDDQRNITRHKVVARFFGQGEEQRGSGVFTEEYEIDKEKDVNERYPLIDDADSSQHSALIDAINGRDLVIEGPPGTGKSQTITNLIAAALGLGKRVLFVAEKMAALEVVKRRLDNAGLGDFCLELHSHKTQKRRMLDDIRHRLGKRYPSGRNWADELKHHEQFKRKLMKHAELMNQDYGQTHKTIHEILTSATRYREELKIDPTTVHPSNFEPSSLTSTQLREVTDNVRIYGEVYTQVLKELGPGKELNSHPWYGVCDEELQHFDADEVCRGLDGWQQTLVDLNDATGSLATLLACPTVVISGFEILNQLLLKLDEVTALEGHEDLTAIAASTHSDLKQLEDLLQEYTDLCDLQGKLYGRLIEDVLKDEDSVASLSSAVGRLQRLGVPSHVPLSGLLALVSRIENALQVIHEIESGFDQLIASFAPETGRFFPPTLSGYQLLLRFMELIAEADIGLLGHRNALFENAVLDAVLPQCHKLVMQLKPLRDQLRYRIDLSANADVAELREISRRLDEHSGLLCWFRKEWRTARAEYLQYRINKNVSFKELVSILDQFIEYAELLREFDSGPDYQSLLQHHFDGIDTAVADLVALRSWYKAVRDEYGIGFGNRVVVGDAIIGVPLPIVQGVKSLYTQGSVQQLTDYLGFIAELPSVLGRVDGFSNGKAIIAGEDNLLAQLKEELGTCVSALEAVIKQASRDLGSIDKTVQHLGVFHERRERWEANDLIARIFSGRIELPLDVHADHQRDLDIATNTLHLFRNICAIGIEDASNCIKGYTAIGDYEELSECVSDLQRRIKAQDERYRLFQSRAKVQTKQWTACSADRFVDLIERNQSALDNPNWLSHWVSFYRFRNVLIDAGFENLAKQIESGELSLEEAHAACMLGIHDLLARDILKNNRSLGRFAGSQHQVLQNEFRKNDHGLKTIQQKRIAHACGQHIPPAGISSGLVRDYTELALIQRECEKKARHIPIRQLVNRSQEALMALKPCFMMGPMSVAQYLQPGTIEFDLVIMDEASQIRPEDALGAIARGKQIVIVGDPKQLPPTSFFDKLIDDVDEENLTVLEDSESVLEAVMPMFNLRRLRWHYRSRHESLISFSNINFYDSNLVLFPSPNRESDEFGIKFHYVKRGKFVNRRNVEEARIVADAVAQHLKRNGNESIGVVAMSAEQRDQLERAFEDLVKSDPGLQGAIETNREKLEPLFFKNLENVQGDERDVMYISCTYGPQEVGGSVPQRFGPINYANGWRRLNVLFSRSKKRMHVFTSMLHSQLRIDSTSSQGLVALKNFLEFAQYKRTSHAKLGPREPDSDFEIAVGRALNQRGYECEYQVGAAGYFIDLAVRDPGNPGRFLMGVECDGATYHSAKSVRDRDRLRQEVLEGLGWKIMRIWSTDWFTNPEGQLNPILTELDNLRTEPVEPIESYEEALDESDREILEFMDQRETLSLNDLLHTFDEEVIRVEQPDVEPARRLLSNAMVEALVHHQPMAKQEFTELVPQYLRSKVDPRQGKFLDQVLEIIENYEAEVAR